MDEPLTMFDAVKQLSIKRFASIIFNTVKNDFKTEEEFLKALQNECPDFVRQILPGMK